MKMLLNPQTLRAVARLVVALDQHRFGAGVFLALVVIVVGASLAVLLL
jgi:hypothetical protein